MDKSYEEQMLLKGKNERIAELEGMVRDRDAMNTYLRGVIAGMERPISVVTLPAIQDNDDVLIPDKDQRYGPVEAPSVWVGDPPPSTQYGDALRDDSFKGKPLPVRISSGGMVTDRPIPPQNVWRY